MNRDETADLDTNRASLRQSYQRILRLYPRSYRAHREAEILDVLEESAGPGQQRPRLGELVALAGLGLRAWSRRTMSPDRGLSRNTLSVLAIMLPLLTVFQAGASLHLAYVMRLASWQMNILTPGWLLWAITALLTTVVPAAARWTGLVATTCFAACIFLLLKDGADSSATMALGYLVLQLCAFALIWDTGRLRRGRDLIGRRRVLVAATALGLAGVAYSAATHYYVHHITGSLTMHVLPILGGAGILAGLVALTKPAGRAALPLLGAIAAAVYSFKDLAGSLANSGPRTRPFGSLQALDIPVALALPVAAFVLLRLVTAVVNFRVAGDRNAVEPRSTGSDVATGASVPDSP
ncbi:hypothetical protein D1871_07925 [Nakamurella silvestris]|nr:hypothetical protein D1871_07925 [Nakamurella silvestris]